MDDYAIYTKDLVKKFGNFAALDGLNLDVEKGVVYGLLGPNGSGKTTSIRVLCGLTKATSGEAYLLGTKAHDKRVAPRIGYMPQEIALYNDLTVRQNLELFGRLQGMNRKDIAEKTGELLEFVNLADWKNALLTTLSGGMKRRVSLICAMIHGPELLILDEPTVGVDPELRASFWEHFGTLKKKGITVMITTHYMDEARNCDRVGFIRAGKLIAEDTPEAISRRAGTVDLEEAFLRYARGEAH